MNKDKKNYVNAMAESVLVMVFAVLALSITIAESVRSMICHEFSLIMVSAERYLFNVSACLISAVCMVEESLSMASIDRPRLKTREFSDRSSTAQVSVIGRTSEFIMRFMA